jgi:hypothetical protein
MLRVGIGDVKGLSVAFCNQCGSEVPEGARFCQSCGAAVSTAAVASGEHAAVPPPTMNASPMPMPPPVPYQPGMYVQPPFPIGPGQALPPARSGKAIAGLWLGVASIFPGILMTWVGILLGILAIVFSVIAVNDIRGFEAQFPGSRPPDGKQQAQIGIALAIIGIIGSTLLLIYILNNLDRFGIRITSP